MNKGIKIKIEVLRNLEGGLKWFASTVKQCTVILSSGKEIVLEKGDCLTTGSCYYEGELTEQERAEQKEAMLLFEV